MLFRFLERLFILVVLIVPFACNFSQKEQLIGRWKLINEIHNGYDTEIDHNMVLDFENDSAYTYYINGECGSGAICLYTVKNDSISFSVFDAVTGRLAKTATQHFNLNNNLLVITSPVNGSFVYKRMKPNQDINPYIYAYNNRTHAKRTGIKKYLSRESHYYTWHTPELQTDSLELTVEISSDGLVRYLFEPVVKPELYERYDYFFSSRLVNNKTIDVLWEKSTYTELHSRILRKLNLIAETDNVKKHPKEGEIFLTYTFINDTTLAVKYHFPEWTKKINKLLGQEVFSNYLYLKDSHIFK